MKPHGSERREHFRTGGEVPHFPMAVEGCQCPFLSSTAGQGQGRGGLGACGGADTNDTPGPALGCGRDTHSQAKGWQQNHWGEHVTNKMLTNMNKLVFD